MVNLLDALQSLRESPQRTLLSALGIMVSSTAILLLISIGLGVQKDVGRQVEGLGVNLLIGMPGRVQMQMGSFNPNMGGQSWYQDQDAARLEKIKGIRSVAKLSFAGGGVKAGEKEEYPFIIACTANWFEMHNAKLAEGRFFTDQDRGSAIIGSIAREALFPDQPALGQEIEINGRRLKVVGVLQNEAQEQSLFSMGSFQNVAYLPFTTHAEMTPNAQIDRLMMQVDPSVEPRSLVEAAERALGERLERQQFSVLTQEDLLRLIYNVMGIVNTLVVGLTAISLFVGGIGILALMMMAVNERRKEIGIRMALGARRKDIFGQIIWESALTGLIGVAAALVFSVLVNWVLERVTVLRPDLNPATIALSALVGIGVGALAGWIPAARAAALDPVVNLRNE
jgi:putative ABC transport system permease protein